MHSRVCAKERSTAPQCSSPDCCLLARFGWQRADDNADASFARGGIRRRGSRSRIALPSPAAHACKKEGGSLDEVVSSSSARHSPGGRASELCLPATPGAVIQITEYAIPVPQSFSDRPKRPPAGWMSRRFLPRRGSRTGESGIPCMSTRIRARRRRKPTHFAHYRTPADAIPHS